MEDSQSLFEQLQDLQSWNSPRSTLVRETKVLESRSVFLNYKEGHKASEDILKLRGSFFFPDENHFAYFSKKSKI